MDEITQLKAQRGDLFMDIERLKAIITQAQKAMSERAGQINELTRKIDELEKAAKDGPKETENPTA